VQLDWARDVDMWDRSAKKREEFDSLLGEAKKLRKCLIAAGKRRAL
jgi:hypothetical protein